MGGIRKDREEEENRKLIRESVLLDSGVLFLPCISGAQVGIGPFLDVGGHLIPVTSPFLVAGLQVRKTAEPAPLLPALPASLGTYLWIRASASLLAACAHDPIVISSG